MTAWPHWAAAPRRIAPNDRHVSLWPPAAQAAGLRTSWRCVCVAGVTFSDLPREVSVQFEPSARWFFGHLQCVIDWHIGHRHIGSNCENRTSRPGSYRAFLSSSALVPKGKSFLGHWLHTGNARALSEWRSRAYVASCASALPCDIVAIPSVFLSLRIRQWTEWEWRACHDGKPILSDPNR